MEILNNEIEILEVLASDGPITIGDKNKNNEWVYTFTRSSDPCKNGAFVFGYSKLGVKPVMLAETQVVNGKEMSVVEAVRAAIDVA